jgi:hypothetical protein
MFCVDPETERVIEEGLTVLHDLKWELVAPLKYDSTRDDHQTMLDEIATGEPKGVPFMHHVSNNIDDTISAHWELRFILLEIIYLKPKTLCGSLGAMFERAKRKHRAWCDDHDYCSIHSGLQQIGKSLRNELSECLVQLGIVFTWTDEDLDLKCEYAPKRLQKNETTASTWKIERDYIFYWIKRQCGPDKYVEPLEGKNRAILDWKTDGLRIASCYIKHHNSLPSNSQ